MFWLGVGESRSGRGFSFCVWLSRCESRVIGSFSFAARDESDAFSFRFCAFCDEKARPLVQGSSLCIFFSSRLAHSPLFLFFLSQNNALGMLRRSRLAAAASPPTTISSSASQPHPLTLSKTYSSTTSLTNYSPTSSRSSLSLEIDLEQEEKDHAVDSNGNASGGGLGGLEVLMKL